MQRTREHYVPSAARSGAPVTPEGTDLAVWSYEHDGQPYALGFAGRAVKPTFHVRFRTDAARAEYLDRRARERREALAERQSRRAERSGYRHTLQVGDILESSWGYDQTNVDFYAVTALHGGTMVTLRKLASELTTDPGCGPMSGYRVPLPGQYTSDPPLRRKVGRGWQGGPYIMIKSYAGASLWDGQPVRCSWYA